MDANVGSTPTLGAKIISMSFGKSYSPQKYWVDEAFQYAESKNVLLIHAKYSPLNDCHPYLGFHELQ